MEMREEKTLLYKVKELYHIPVHGMFENVIRSAEGIALRNRFKTQSDMRLCLQIHRLFLHCTSARP